MPKERQDTQPAAQEEDAEVTPASLEGSGEISAAADQLAAVDEAGSGTTETQQDGVDQLHDPLSDPELWKPHPPTEDCPVCLVPLPVSRLGKNTCFWACCGKTTCAACEHENYRALEITIERIWRSQKELPPLDRSCPFCREPIHKNESEQVERLEKRVGANDIEAIYMMAVSCREGLRGFPKDEAKGMELLKKASDLGSAKAKFQLAISYCYGMFGFPKDEKQYLEYLEAAAKQGHVRSRYTL